MHYQKFILLLFLPFFLTGCINYTELNELGIIETIGIDKQENEYLVSVNIIDAKEENDEGDELRKSYDATGKTITEAMQNLYLKSNKKVYLSHVETLLLSENIAKEDISILLDFFLRNQQSRNSFTTIIVKDTTPSTIIHDTEKSPEINDIIEINSQEYGISSLISFEDFARMLLEEGTDAVLPTIKLENDRLEIDGYAYFQDQKFISYLTKEESLTFNLLKNKNSHIVLKHDCNGNQTGAKLEQLSTFYQSKQDHIELSIKGTLSLTENHCNLEEKEALKIFEEKLKENVKHLLEEQKKRSIDILGLQSYIRQNNYLYYKQHQDTLLDNLSYQIQLQLKYQNNTNLEGTIVNETK